MYALSRTENLNYLQRIIEGQVRDVEMFNKIKFTNRYIRLSLPHQLYIFVYQQTRLVEKIPSTDIIVFKRIE